MQRFGINMHAFVVYLRIWSMINFYLVKTQILHYLVYLLVLYIFTQLLTVSLTVDTDTLQQLEL